MPDERTISEDTEAPDPQLLEFLGSWQTATGEWPASPAAGRVPDTADPTAAQRAGEESNRE